MRRLFGSVRAKATLGATVVVAIALVAAGTAVLLSLRSNLNGQAGTQAERSAREVAADLSGGASYDRLRLDDDQRPVQVVDAKGVLVAASEDLRRISGTGTLAVKPRPRQTAPAGSAGDAADDKSGDDHGGEDKGGDTSGDDEGGDGRGKDGRGRGGGEDDDYSSLEPGQIGAEVSFSEGSATLDGDTADYRFAAVEVSVKSKGALTVYAGAPLSAEQGAVRTALTVMLIGFPLLLAVVAAVTWRVTRRALRPVEGIRSEMAAITASEDLARRVPVPDTQDEVAGLARTTNETLAALETSVERQRRFVADASHELRSPIASLRTQLEVGAAHPELLDVTGAVEDTVRLQRLAADLLLLARLDAGERPSGTRFDLTALAREEVSRRPGVTVEGASAEVVGSRGQLVRLLGNLLDNARRHARSRVAVTLRTEGPWAVLEVADDGAGVPADDRERIFERFVRLDEARSRDDGGAGLGLAIARDVALRHGGTLTVGEARGGGALFTLRLPGPAA
ncbi:HAMP domain-containing histidine kinase [Streptomyces sp. NBC_01571]|uniref:sensor histidine kinase n=1 Tax=Streptomyces sp. NBC_01571 TaxID=2975883 RepID=UPI002252EBE4|nr:HAMP domain-containing sensor histidine kinase [Streptomyces sp. NBC_01571]MCX4577584.1 HAMP domain-containing histidine kinase [Streptomyces sp. NBC_01571]